jgi:hypothetical protein
MALIRQIIKIRPIYSSILLSAELHDIKEGRKGGIILQKEFGRITCPS